MDLRSMVSTFGNISSEQAKQMTADVLDMVKQRFSAYKQMAGVPAGQPMETLAKKAQDQTIARQKLSDYATLSGKMPDMATLQHFSPDMARDFGSLAGMKTYEAGQNDVANQIKMLQAQNSGSNGSSGGLTPYQLLQFAKDQQESDDTWAMNMAKADPRLNQARWEGYTPYDLEGNEVALTAEQLNANSQIPVWSLNDLYDAYLKQGRPGGSGNFSFLQTVSRGGTPTRGGSGGGDLDSWIQQAGIDPADIPSLKWIIQHESGGNPTAQNPNSTAYGLMQFLDSTWGNYGYEKTSDPVQQLIAGNAYIKQRYGSADAAKAFWEKNHWY